MKYFIRFFAIALGILFCGNISRAELLVETVCHVKGQETNTLTGVGLVVGLKGTGDKAKDFTETARSLGVFLENFGHSQISLKEMIAAKNVALVSVTVTIPGTGARDGELLDCHIASFGSASSLEGGELLLTPLRGPVPSKSPTEAIIYGQASGRISIEKPTIPTVGRVTGGCRLLDDFFNPYVKDGIITLVIDRRFAGWEMARTVAAAVDQEFGDGVQRARAINQQNVMIMLPENEDPVQFIADFMKNEILPTFKVPTVIINERAGLVSIEGDVEITPTTITHGGMTITIAPPPAADAPTPPTPLKPERFVGIDTESKRNNVENVKLKALTESLNALNVPEKGVIEIIKALYDQGTLQGRVIYQ